MSNRALSALLTANVCLQSSFLILASRLPHRIRQTFVGIVHEKCSRVLYSMAGYVISPAIQVISEL